MYIHSPEAQFLNKHHGWFPKVCFSIAFYHGVFKADLQPRFSFCCKPSSALSTQQVVASLSDPEIKIGAGYFPRATRLLDGSLLGVYSSFSSGSTTLKTIISKDAGASWQPLGSIAGEVTNTTDLDNPFVVQLPSGRVVSAFRNHSRGPDTHHYTYHRITCPILMTTAQAGPTSVNQRPKQAPSTESGKLFSAMLLTVLYSYTAPANLPATTRAPFSASPPTGARPGLPRVQSPEPESSLVTA